MDMWCLLTTTNVQMTLKILDVRTLTGDLLTITDLSAKQAIATIGAG